MKNTLQKIVLAATLLLTPCVSNSQSLNIRTYGEIRLDLEKGTMQKDHRELEKIMAEAQVAIPTLKTNDYNSAMQALEAMQIFLAKKGFSYHSQDFLNKGLRTKKIDCDIYSILFMSMAEKKGYPVKMVEVGAKNKIGSHAFIKWYLDNGEVINWETTSGFAYSQTKDMLPAHLEQIIERKYGIIKDDIEIVVHDSKESYVNRTIEMPSLDRNLRVLPIIHRGYAEDMVNFYEKKAKEGPSQKWQERKEKLENSLKDIRDKGL